MTTDHSQVLASAKHIRSLLPQWYDPTVGIIGGSGLSALEGAITAFEPHSSTDSSPNVQEPRLVISFKELTGFPIPSVQGHSGKLIFGMIVTRHGKQINAVLLSGRAHFYEGGNPKDATFPVRVLGALGIKVLIVTNAAGGLNRDYRIGDIMVINDHISFPSLSGSYNPLLGPLDISSIGPSPTRQHFLALSDAYDHNLRRAAWQAWKNISSITAEVESSRFLIEGAGRKRRLQEGTYAMVAGPSYETRAESRLLSYLGADVVGMSTVPEVIVARHMGVRVLGLTLVTNLAVLERVPRGDEMLDETELDKYDISIGKADHAEVLEAGKIAAEVMKDLIVEILDKDET